MRGTHYSDFTQMWADPGDASPNLATRDPRKLWSDWGGEGRGSPKTQHNSQPELNRPPTDSLAGLVTILLQCRSPDWRLVTVDNSPRFNIDASLRAKGPWRIRPVGCVKHWQQGAQGICTFFILQAFSGDLSQPI